MQRIDRRDFLKIGAGAAIVLGASPLLADCGGGSQSISSKAAPSAASSPLTKVSIVKGTDLRAMARDAVDAVGGIGSVVSQGQTIFIKPNFVTIGWASSGRDVFANGECTKPEILTRGRRRVLEGGRGGGNNRRRDADAEVAVGQGPDAGQLHEHGSRSAAPELRLRRKGDAGLPGRRLAGMGGLAIPDQLAEDLHLQPGRPRRPHHLHPGAEDAPVGAIDAFDEVFRRHDAAGQVRRQDRRHRSRASSSTQRPAGSSRSSWTSSRA